MARGLAFLAAVAALLTCPGMSELDATMDGRTVEAGGSHRVEHITITLDGVNKILELSDEDWTTSALRFCQAHDLVPQHCNELLAFVKAKESGGANGGGEGRVNGGNGSGAGAGDADEGGDRAAIHVGEQESEGVDEEESDGRVDYSQRVGPVLTITMPGGASQLQRYKGESIEDATAR